MMAKPQARSEELFESQAFQEVDDGGAIMNQSAAKRDALDDADVSFEELSQSLPIDVV